ncbi:MAG: cytochrome c maturation protein CcmE, partial [Proteobacteria bacterium]|nr:cytochrome c maturation protein CcmE [Pseudomonadota bacterium]
MTPTRKRRLMIILLVILGATVATLLFTMAFKENIMFFKSPSDIVAGDYPKDRNFRIGGMVKKGSLVRSTDSLKISFVVTDYAE